MSPPSSGSAAPSFDEYSFVLVKPDATIHRDIGVTVFGRIVNEVEGARELCGKVMRLTPEFLCEHYAHIADKPFYPRIERYMMSGEVWARIIGGKKGTIQKIRDVVGPTNPIKAKADAPASIRAQFGEVTPEGDVYNVVHASDSQEAAYDEIRRFFRGDEQMIWRDAPDLAEKLYGVPN